MKLGTLSLRNGRLVFVTQSQDEYFDLPFADVHFDVPATLTGTGFKLSYGEKRYYIYFVSPTSKNPLGFVKSRPKVNAWKELFASRPEGGGRTGYTVIEVGKKKARRRSLQGEQKETYIELGREVYRLMEDGRSVESSKIDALASQLDELDETIGELSADLEARTGKG
jgi:hypothetical protein